MPAKSSLSKIRRKISYKFFQQALDLLLQNFSRSTFRGFHIYAVDGKKAYIPRSSSNLKLGYRGRKVSRQLESYHLRLYLTHAFDVLSGVTKQLDYSSENLEAMHAKEYALRAEANSITLYDRYHQSYSLIDCHLQAGNFFVIRCKFKSTFAEVEKFAASSKKRDSFLYNGVVLYLCKVKSPKGSNIFLTNLNPSKFSPKEVAHLYRLRWEVETSFRYLVESLSLEQWHSPDHNNILQELYARFWLFNFTKILGHMANKKQNPLGQVYRRANTKLMVEWVRENIKRLLNSGRGGFKELGILIKKSTETRRRYSRSYPREIKMPGSPYKPRNTVWILTGELA